MATFEQEQSQRQTLKQVLEQIIAIDPNSLVRADVLGKELSFEPGLPVFQRTIGLFKELSDCTLDNVPFEVLQQLNAQANQALSQFQQVRGFSVAQNSNPQQFRDSLTQQLRESWNAYYTAIIPHVAYSTRRGTDFDSLEREARGRSAMIDPGSLKMLLRRHRSSMARPRSLQSLPKGIRERIRIDVALNPRRPTFGERIASLTSCPSIPKQAPAGPAGQAASLVRSR